MILPPSHEQFMKQALLEAHEAFQKDEVPIGAIVVYKNKIIAKAHNLTEQLNDTTAHAEIQALTAATNFIGGKYLNDCTLYVTLEPCAMCAGALAWAQLGALVYGAYDPQRGFSHYSPSLLHKRTTVTSGILENECKTILTDFFKNKRKNLSI